MRRGNAFCCQHLFFFVADARGVGLENDADAGLVRIEGGRPCAVCIIEVTHLNDIRNIRYILTYPVSGHIYRQSYRRIVSDCNQVSGSPYPVVAFQGDVGRNVSIVHRYATCPGKRKFYSAQRGVGSGKDIIGEEDFAVVSIDSNIRAVH